jgi:tetratricopeptide (TPR) repeat protein
MPIPDRLRALAPYGGVFALALAVRLAYLWSWHETALFTTPVGDARVYLAWASELASGNWLGREVFYQAPLYPYFLGVLATLFGDGPWVARLVQAGLGSCACALLAAAGTAFFDRRTGILAGLGLALYAPAIFFDGLIQKAALDGFATALVLLAFARLVDRDRPLVAFGAGVALGLLALLRENALVLVPLAAVFVAVAGPRRPSSRRVVAIGLLGVGLALPLLPVGLRNQAVGGDFLLTTSQLGPNLWIGNHPGATGRYEPLRPGRGSALYERDDARALAEQAQGRALSPAEVSDHFRDRALAFAREQPLEWLRLLARKWALVWNARELPDTEGLAAYAAHSPLLRGLHFFFGFGVLAPLAAIGALATRRDARRLWVLWATIGLLAASVALFFVFARYRFTLVPALMLFAAAGLASLLDALRARDLRRALGLGAVAALVAAFAHLPLVGETDVAITHFSVGSELLERGRAREAIAELERAVAAAPDFPQASLKLADAIRETGDPVRALARCDAVIATAPELADAHVSRGLALAALGRGDEAITAFQRALALDPRHADAHNDLGNAFVARRRSAEAIAHYREALLVRPGDPSFEANLGAGLLQAGAFADALVHLERALVRAPGLSTARLNAATAREGLGRIDEARAGYRDVLRAEPAGSPLAALAREGLARIGSGGGAR